MDAKAGVIARSVLTPIVSGMQVWDHRERLAPAGRLRAMLAGGLVGTAIGTQLRVILPTTAVTAALGLFTRVVRLDRWRTERPPLTQRWLGPVAGLAGGISNGASGHRGPVFGTYLTAIATRR